MIEELRLTYCDRETGNLVIEPVYANGFLSWSYNSRLGWSATQLLLRQKFITWLYGWFQKQWWSRRKIKPFVDQLHVKIEESKKSLEEFESFNDFFTRDIDLSKRPIQLDPHVCISPTDGRVLAYPVMHQDHTFRIKRSSFNLRQFLRDGGLAEEFSGGSMVISRLYLSDFHHFYFPDSGVPGPGVSISGSYYAVSPYALRRLVPFYTENHRTLTLFDSDHFGRIAMVEIGAFTVGSIQQRYRPGIPVRKGDHKGFFEIGGSTVVLLFRKGAIRLDADLCSNTRGEIETYVRLGDSIGRI